MITIYTISIHHRNMTILVLQKTPYPQINIYTLKIGDKKFKRSLLVEVSRRLCAFAFYVIRTCLLRVSAVYGLFIFLFFVRFICFLRSVFFFFFFSLDKISPMLLLRLLSYYVLFHGLGVCLSHSLDSLSLSLLPFFSCACD